MSVASTRPSGPARRAAVRVCSPAPAATSSTREPGPTPAMSSIVSVAAPSQRPTSGPQRSQASAAVSHWARVTWRNLTGSKVGVATGVSGMTVSLKCRRDARRVPPRCPAARPADSPDSGVSPAAESHYTFAMIDYGQFCTVARGAEVLGELWTPLVVRELLCGSKRFNEIHRGVPKMSATLLTQRLRKLEEMGVVERRKAAGGS